MTPVLSDDLSTKFHSEGYNMKIWLMAFSVFAVLGLTACDSNSRDENRDGANMERGSDTN